MNMCSSCGVNEAYENSTACHACYTSDTHDKQSDLGGVQCCHCSEPAVGRFPYNESPRCRRHMPKMLLYCPNNCRDDSAKAVFEQTTVWHTWNPKTRRWECDKCGA